MHTPWFFATTRAPRPAVPERRRSQTTPLRSWWAHLPQAYVTWAERSRRRPHGSHALI